MKQAVGLILIIILLPSLTVQAHTPGVMMSILKEGGPEPTDVLESVELYEGDGIKFKVGDNGENVSMRVSIDLDGDNTFNQSNDFFSDWMVYDCQIDENGTLLVAGCSESVVFNFTDGNNSGTYYYQVERRIEENHTNSWIYTIYVGVDVHEEPSTPNIGDCFGSGCEVDDVKTSSKENSNKELNSVFIVVSAKIGRAHV